MTNALAILETAEKIVKEPNQITANDYFSIHGAVIESILYGLLGDKYDEKRLQELEEKLVEDISQVYRAIFENIADEKNGTITLEYSEIKSLAKHVFSKKPLIESGKENIYSVIFEYVNDVINFLKESGFINDIIEYATENSEIRDYYLIETNNDLDRAAKLISEAATLAAVIFLETLGAPEMKLVLEACKRKKSENKDKKSKEEKMVESAMKKLLPVVKLIDEIKITV